jgi:hypothetical protein
MQTVEEVLDWLSDHIGHIYSRPEMYAETLCELDAVLFTVHTVWGNIAGRYPQMVFANADLCENSDFGGARGFADFRTVIPVTESAAYARVVDHWRKVDEGLGVQFVAKPLQ